MKFKSEAKKIVIKVGTSTLTYDNGNVNIRTIDKLCKVISDLCNGGREIILVSSGAIGVGMGKLNMKERPTETKYRQALAAVGQCELMFIYDKLFGEYNNTVSQVLLTRRVVDNEITKRNVKNTINTLISMKIIPIINENDAVSTCELEGANFGDNDNLSAIVAKMVKADLLLILTDIDGLYEANPRLNKNAKKISVVEKIDDKIKEIAGGSGSNRGTGGMITKVSAAQFANEAGIDCCVMNGADPEKIYSLLDGVNVGTIFKA